MKHLLQELVFPEECEFYAATCDEQGNVSFFAVDAYSPRQASKLLDNLEYIDDKWVCNDHPLIGLVQEVQDKNVKFEEPVLIRRA